MSDHGYITGTYNADLTNDRRQLIVEFADEASGKFAGKFGAVGNLAKFDGWFNFHKEEKYTSLHFTINGVNYKFTQPYYPDGVRNFSHFRGAELNADGTEKASWEFRYDDGTTTSPNTVTGSTGNLGGGGKYRG